MAGRSWRLIVVGLVGSLVAFGCAVTELEPPQGEGGAAGEGGDGAQGTTGGSMGGRSTGGRPANNGGSSAGMGRGGNAGASGSPATTGGAGGDDTGGAAGDSSCAPATTGNCHFEPLGGDYEGETEGLRCEGGASRAQSADYMMLVGATSIDDCEAACLEQPDCTAVSDYFAEPGLDRCEISIGACDSPRVEIWSEENAGKTYRKVCPPRRARVSLRVPRHLDALRRERLSTLDVDQGRDEHPGLRDGLPREPRLHLRRRLLLAQIDTRLLSLQRRVLRRRSTAGRRLRPRVPQSLRLVIAPG